ncbi:MAG: hypothetical protein QOJ42_809, partial [Acidobacteriaceae bacterium]|nr:hypothetical protein [Acidobacteriaceae bacterium]
KVICVAGLVDLPTTGAALLVQPKSAEESGDSEDKDGDSENEGDVLDKPVKLPGQWSPEDAPCRPETESTSNP